MSYDPEAISRFNREAANARAGSTTRTYARCMTSAKPKDGTIYLAMEFVEGKHSPPC